MTVKLKPLFKKGSKTAPKNYRSIFLLPIVSKIIKKVIHNQTQSFPDYSTDSCLSYLNNKIATGFKSCLCTAMILTNLQKAFDTVNHHILIKKNRIHIIL